jgi:hypothetical protein
MPVLSDRVVHAGTHEVVGLDSPVRVFVLGVR